MLRPSRGFGKGEEGRKIRCGASWHTHRRHPRMSAIALTREVRALARLEGWTACTLIFILRGSPKTARTSRGKGIAFIPGMTVLRCFECLNGPAEVPGFPARPRC